MTNRATVAIERPSNPQFGYGEVAPVYLSAGHETIPANGKVPLVSGATGYRGVITSAKIEKWRGEYGYANTALRLPRGQLGLDVDNEAHLERLVRSLGPLPATVSSTSRGAASSRRIYCFVVPEDLLFKDRPAFVDAGPGEKAEIEVVSFSNRVMVVSPSVHPETHEMYAWYGPDGSALDHVPHREEFAELPDNWVTHLRQDRAVRTDGAFDGSLDVQAWLGEGELSDWGNELHHRVIAASHIGHAELLEFISDICLLRDLHEPGLAAIDRTLLSRLLSTSSPKNSATELHREFENVWRFVLGESWVPKPRGLPVRLWAESNQAQAKSRKAQSEQALHDFWDRRPILKHVQETAFKTLLSPWALLGALCQRTLLDIPYMVAYQSNRGKAALNSTCAFVGQTGMGKTLTHNVLDDAFEMSGDKWRSSVREAGSGEGIMDAYRFQAKDPETGKMTRQWINPNHALQFGFDEVGSLTGRQARQGTTIFETLKSAESGASLTRVLAGGAGSELAKGEYRFCLFVNVQPAKAADLFDDAAVSGGLPGRFLWFSTQNETAEQDWIDGPVTKFRVHPVDWTGKTVIAALPSMLAAHKRDAIAGHKGERDELDSHSVLTRAKVAIAFAVMDGRSELLEADWELSGVVMDHSNETRALVQSALKAAGARDLNRQGYGQGVRNAKAKEVEEEREVAKIAARILDLRSQGVPETGKGGLKQRLRSDKRKYFDDALTLLANGGK